MQQELERMRDASSSQREQAVAAVKLRLSQAEDRLGRLTDAYIDRLIDQDLFEGRKKALLSERRDLEDQMVHWQSGKRDVAAELAEFLERADTAFLAYKDGIVDEKRDLLDSMTSNRLVDRKTPIITLSLPFRAIAERPKVLYGSTSSYRCKTFISLTREVYHRLTNIRIEPESTQVTLEELKVQKQ